MIAVQTAEALTQCNHDTLVLPGRDVLVDKRAMESLRSTATDLDIATAQYAKAVKVLGDGSLRETVRHYVDRHQVVTPILFSLNELDHVTLGAIDRVIETGTFCEGLDVHGNEVADYSISH